MLFGSHSLAFLRTLRGDRRGALNGQRAKALAFASLLVTFGCSAAGRPAELGQAPTYERGLQIFPSPRRFDPPGTIFRIDPDGVRRSVADLSALLHVVPREEAVPRLSVYGSFNAGAYFSWLGVPASSAFDRVDSAVIAVTGARREQTFEVDLRQLVDSAARIVDWRRPGSVYLITETVLADSVEISLSRSMRIAVGDSIRADSAALHGVAVRWTPHSTTHLALRFQQPHRVFYKVELLRAHVGFGFERSVERIAVSEALLWRT